MSQFNRIASLRLGNPDTPGYFLEITGLRISFRITKNLKTTSNTAVIEIYNLNETTRNRVREVFDTVILEAGYQDGDGLKLLFQGNISESFTRRQGPNLVTVIRSGDGLKAIVETKFNRGYAAGVSAWDILDDIVTAMGLPKKWSNKLKQVARKKGNKFANAFTSAGSAQKAMDKIVKSLDIEWSVQNGATKILDLEGVDDSPITYLTPDTGLIGLPVRVYNLKKREDTKEKIEPNSPVKNVQRKGWILDSLLIPEIEPGARLDVREEVSGINGVYRLEDIEQRGDNFGTNWNSSITVADLT